MILKPTLLTLQEKIGRVFAKDFCVAISDKENMYVWGRFLDEVMSPTNPFKQEDYASNNVTHD